MECVLHIKEEYNNHSIFDIDSYDGRPYIPTDEHICSICRAQGKIVEGANRFMKEVFQLAPGEPSPPLPSRSSYKDDVHSDEEDDTYDADADGSEEEEWRRSREVEVNIGDGDL